LSTWSDLATEAQRDAAMAKERGSHRAALNRCYYALFSEIARGAVIAGCMMPAGWEGPHHKAVYGGKIVADHLGKWLKPTEQGRLAFMASLLYKLRIQADYSPSAVVEENDVRLAFGRLIEARRIMESVK
jgi:hypothetical protein